MRCHTWMGGMENSRELGVVGGKSREDEMLTLARDQRRWHRNVAGVPELEPGSPSCRPCDAEKMTYLRLFL